MNTIYKYELKITDEQDVLAPDGAAVVAVHEQEGRLYLWAAVDLDIPQVQHKVYVRGTGHPLDWPLSGDVDLQDAPFHIGTAFMSNGLVWHVFSTSLSRYI